MAGEKQTPNPVEDPAMAAAETPVDEGAEKAEAPTQKPEDKKAIESFQAVAIKKKDEAIEKVEKDIEGKYMKKSSPEVSQRAIGKWNEIMGHEKMAIHHSYVGAIKKFEKVTDTSSSSREQLAKELLNDADRQTNLRMTLLKLLIESKVKGEFVTTEEVAEIDKAIKGLDEFEKNNEHLQKLFLRIVEGQQLSTNDYVEIAKHLKPFDIEKDSKASVNSFEATSGGILVGALSEKQRVSLLKTCFELYDAEPDTAFRLLDAFLVNGLIKEGQAKEILAIIKPGSGADPEKADRVRKQVADVDGKIESGHYREQRILTEKMREEHFQKYRGIYAENINNRFWLRKPFWGLLGMVWGTATIAVNAFVSYPKGKEKGKRLQRVGEWLKNVAKNPYVWGGAAAVAGGAEIAGSSMKTGEWFGAGPISRALEGGEEKEAPMVEINARKYLEETRESGPKQLVEYMEHGGYKNVLTLRAEIVREKKQKLITLEELLKSETDPAQKQRLAALRQLPTISEQTINQKLTGISEAGFILKLKNDEEFQKVFNPQKAE